MSALFWLHALVAIAVLSGVALARVLRAADVAFWHRVWSGVALAALAVVPLAAAASIGASATAGRWVFRAVLVAYAAGTLLLLIRLVAGLLLVRRLAARGLPLEGPWRARLRAIVGEDAERCRVHARVQVPLAVGGPRPGVLLPEGWVRWDDDRVRAVVRHELAHLDRHDFGWNVVGAVFEACFWPNPLAWMLTDRLRLLAECACDRRAADHVGAEAYVTVLIASARELGAGERGPKLLAPGAATGLAARIASLLAPARPILVVLLLASATAVIAAGQSTPGPITLPTQRTANVFFARTTINGAGPFWLTVDTGATLTVLDPATVRALGLPERPAGQFANVGVAEAATDMATTAGATLFVGDAPPFSPSPLYVVSVGAHAGFRGQRIDGVLGTDFLRRFVVEFNYGASRVVLHQPDTFAYRGAGTRIAMTVQGNVLLASGRLALPDGDTVMARLLVDTGSSQGLSLNSPFVARHRLAERFQQPMQPGTSRRASVSIGINGMIASQMIKLPSLAFGTTVIAEPDAALSSASEGLTATERFDGIIGAALLEPFTVIVDYPRREIILERVTPRSGG